MERFERDFSSLQQFQEYIRYENQYELFENTFARSVSGKEFSDMYKTDTWVIDPSSGEHKAGFPLELPKLVTKLFSLPGDRIADPTVGFGTTLKAIQEINEESSHPIKRKGVGWEDFSGEQEGQRDYLEELTRTLSTKANQPYRSI